MLNRRQGLVIVVTILLLTALVAVLTRPPAIDENLKAAAGFIVRQYNTVLRLCREAPYAAPNVFWLMSDNSLAQYALRTYDPEMSTAILDELMRRGYASDGHWDAVLGKPIPVPNKVMMTLTIEESEDYVIKVDVRNEARYFVDWASYADRLLLHALSLMWQGDIEHARVYFGYAKELWTGTGVRDPPESWTTQYGVFETYKLALLLLVSHVLQEPLPFQQALEDILWRMQREDGGIVTHYHGDTLEPWAEADANTETTAITIIAYTYKR